MLVRTFAEWSPCLRAADSTGKERYRIKKTSTGALKDDEKAKIKAELDLAGLAKPRWGHHSLQRLGDTVARQTRGDTGATEQDIDLTFGWQEAMHSRQMQTHYESVFIRTRRACVTSML